MAPAGCMVLITQVNEPLGYRALGLSVARAGIA